MKTASIRRPYLFLALLCQTFISVADTVGGPPAHGVATFAGGGFWYMEAPFDGIDGVISTTPGYTGGSVDNPTYKQVSRGKTDHTEAVQILFDPARVTYTELLDVFWRNIDPTNANGQFCEWGSQYRSEIFYHDEEQQRTASASRAALEQDKPFKEPVITRITAAGRFWPAEDFHQDYYKKNPMRYKFNRYGCGRDKRLEELWGENK